MSYIFKGLNLIFEDVKVKTMTILKKQNKRLYWMFIFSQATSATLSYKTYCGNQNN